jgi:hypothetical protein
MLVHVHTILRLHAFRTPYDVQATWSTHACNSTAPCKTKSTGTGKTAADMCIIPLEYALAWTAHVTENMSGCAMIICNIYDIIYNI